MNKMNKNLNEKQWNASTAVAHSSVIIKFIKQMNRKDSNVMIAYKWNCCGMNSAFKIQGLQCCASTDTVVWGWS